MVVVVAVVAAAFAAAAFPFIGLEENIGKSFLEAESFLEATDMEGLEANIALMRGDDHLEGGGSAGVRRQGGEWGRRPRVPQDCWVLRS